MRPRCAPSRALARAVVPRRCTALAIVLFALSLARRGRRATSASAGGRAKHAARARHRAASATARRPPAAALLVANHVSWLDIMAIHAVAPQARFVSKADVKAGRCSARLVDAGRHAVPRARAKARRAARRPRRSPRRCGAGETVAVFPEGTTSTGTACCRSTPTCCRRRSPPATPVQPVALRFSDAAHAVSAGGRVRRRHDACSAACGDVVRRRRPALAVRVPAAARLRPDADRRALAALLRADSAAARRASSRGAGAGDRRLGSRPGRLVRHRGRRLRRRFGDRRGSSCGSASARRRARRPAGCRSGC